MHQTPPGKAESKCLARCGFYGSAATKGYCSVCYKVFLKAESNASKINANLSSNNVSPIVNDFKSSPLEKKLTELERNDNINKKLNDNYSSDKCNKCSRKLGLIKFKCRCGLDFCRTHLLAEEHSCTFDYRSQNQERLERSNPKLEPSKLERMS